MRVALSWVQQNIADFGGDVQKVTLAGHGQGAALAHLLALNPTTSSTFQKLILMSGSALCEGSLSSPKLSAQSSSSYSASSSSSTSSTPPPPVLPHPWYTYRDLLTATQCSRFNI